MDEDQATKRGVRDWVQGSSCKRCDRQRDERDGNYSVPVLVAGDACCQGFLTSQMSNDSYRELVKSGEMAQHHLLPCCQTPLYSLLYQAQLPVPSSISIAIVST